MPSLVIVADDFTGACDTGLPLAAAGLEVRVKVGPLPEADVEVLVLDTETRHRAPEEAAQQVKKVVEGIEARLWYKKIDSTLRGPFAAELKALMEVRRFSHCLLAPAFPSAGRTTIGGYHLLHGVPVARTEMARDRGTPVRSSHLPRLLAEAGLPVYLIDLEIASQGETAILRELAELPGPLVVVCDAVEAGDLAVVARAAACLDPPPLLCGSAGLAAHLPEAFGLRGRSHPSLPSRQGGILILAGSHHPQTRRQLALAQERLGLTVQELAQVQPQALAAALARGECVGIVTQKEEGRKREEVASEIRSLAHLGRHLAASGELAGIAATGGWTAIEVLRALEAQAVEICEELDTGVPLASVSDGPFAGLLLATKAGALGGDEVFLKIAARLSARPAAKRPLLAITLGDPAGIGPEIVAKALAEPEIYSLCRPLVVGHPAFLEANLRFAGRPLSLRQVARPEEGLYCWGTLDLLSPIEVAVDEVKIGRVCPEGGRAAGRWVEVAADLALTGQVDGLVTAPLNKEALRQAGFPYAGHTELLAARTQARESRMMLVADRLKVVHVTTHLALREALGQLTRERIYTTIALAHQALIDLGLAAPRLGVAGLNPHAGEAGLFGDEEQRFILPAVEQARAQGWQVSGPLPPDTLFLRAWQGEFDAAIALYHDQGHIPVKLLAFAEAVNLTLGLPIVRTSVDHGTAFDLAGQGVADPRSLLQAIRLAAKLSATRQRPTEKA